MKTANDVVKGRIVDVDNGIVTIKCRYDDWFTLTKRGYKECNVQMIDSRPLSDKQRKLCYALIREIADFAGYGTNAMKDLMKVEFMAEVMGDTADRIFSLSNAPMSLVCEFQRFLIRFILDKDIPCSFPLLDYVDDVPDYIYSCLINKKCVVCGRKADLHHVDHVGMGNRFPTGRPCRCRYRGDLVTADVLPFAHHQAHLIPPLRHRSRYGQSPQFIWLSLR